MKKLIAMACAVLLVCALCAPALAANEYSLDFSDVTVTNGSPSGYAKIVVTGDEEVPKKLYARVTFSVVNAKGETSLLSQTGPVDMEEMEFDMPALTTSDEITCVAVVVLDAKNLGPGWAGHNICPPARVV